MAPSAGFDVSGRAVPNDLSSFIGRRDELQALDQALGKSRLVTLIGPGGCGKTRLAFRAAREVSGFPDGVFVVELATETSGDLIASRVAAAAGVVEASGTPLEASLSQKLSDARVLVVIDNCEHLVDDCAALVQGLLRNCTSLAFLCTSQEPLGVPGEKLLGVPPLALPSQGAELSPDLAIQSDAVTLFVDRAKLVASDFDLTPENVEDVVEICRSLDGLPLAIELAAARSRLLSARAIRERLADRFELLVGRSRTGIARHQTLRATVGWSYESLTLPERVLFNRLSVFSGGFDVSAAESVCVGEPIQRTRVLGILERLAEKSMIVPDGTHEGRHRLLETLRHFAAEHLVEAGVEADAVRDQHSRYYLQLVQSVAGGSSGWYETVALDIDNVRAALSWAMTRRAADAARTVNALVPYWVDRSELSEARRWLEYVLASVPPRNEEYEQSMLGAGRVAWEQADLAGAERYASRTLEMARASSNSGRMASALAILSGVMLYSGRPDRAEELQREALELRAQIGDQEGAAGCLNNLGLVALERGRYVDAEQRLSEALERARELGTDRLEATIHESFGRLHLAQGKLDEAEREFTLSLSLAHHVSKALAATAVEDLALVSARRKRWLACIRLAAAANALRADVGVGQPSRWRETYSREVEYAKAQVRPVEMETATASGVRLNVDELLRPPPMPHEVRVGGLTRRELMVVRAIARGLSDKEVARALGISTRTVQSHVEHIKTRLGVRTRTQIAAWAVENRESLDREQT